MKKLLVVMAALMAFATPSFAASFADVTFVIDQSGSMGGEFAWIGNSLSTIDTEIQNAGITTNYGVAGYENLAGSADARNAWVDLPSGIGNVVTEVNNVNLYGGFERHYHAVEWAGDNFSWTGGNYAKVMILVTDEPGNSLSSFSYGGLLGEAALGQYVSDNNILLNVITQRSNWSLWDSVALGGTAGLFDLDFLRTNATAFTQDFTSRKIQEIINTNPVPEPSTFLLLGGGVAALAFYRRKKMA